MAGSGGGADWKNPVKRVQFHRRQGQIQRADILVQMLAAFAARYGKGADGLSPMADIDSC
jgi:hypothetical protein